MEMYYESDATKVLLSFEKFNRLGPRATC